MRFKIITIVILVSLGFFACETKERVKGDSPKQAMQGQQQETSAMNHVVKVEEAIHAKSYTYLRVTEGEQEYWIATAKQPIQAGMTMYYDQGMEMKDFESKELERTFDSIWFVGLMSGQSSRSMTGNTSGSMGTATPAAADKSISIEKAGGGLSVAELYADMAKYEGQSVSVRGQVTKVNTAIMGRNWVHIQDGTSSGKYFDITLTTMDMVARGDVVVFTGKVVLNKDFGAGYKYDLIIEEAVLAKES